MPALALECKIAYGFEESDNVNLIGLSIEGPHVNFAKMLTFNH